MRRFGILVLFCLALSPVFFTPGVGLAGSRQSMMFEAPQDLRTDGVREATLDEIRAFGVERVRATVHWSWLAPAPNSPKRPHFNAADPNAYPAHNWAPIDRLVEAATQRGLQVYMTVDGPAPTWATGQPKAPARKGRPARLLQRSGHVFSPSAAEFQQFVTAVGRRYRGKVTAWAVWNEPNRRENLLPQREAPKQFRKRGRLIRIPGKPLAPAIYRQLFLAGVRGLQNSGNANNEIYFGETAPGGSRTVLNHVGELELLRGTLCLDHRNRRDRRCKPLVVDGFAHHPYFSTAGPLPILNQRFDEMTKLLNQAQRSGAVRARRGGKVQLAITEFGVQSYPDRLSGVPLLKQAEYLALSEYVAYRYPQINIFSQYLMHDDTPRFHLPLIKRYSGFETGLRYWDSVGIPGAPGTKGIKPSYYGFRTPLAILKRRGGKAEFWGRIRPEKRSVPVTIEFSYGNDHWQKLQDLRTQGNGVFSFQRKLPPLVKRGRSIRQAVYRVKYVTPTGAIWRGPPTRPY